MRKLVREDVVTTVQVLEYTKGEVVELEKLDIPGLTGKRAIERATKIMKKSYPNRNVFCGEVTEGRYRYEMEADVFMRTATKTEVK